MSIFKVKTLVLLARRSWSILWRVRGKWYLAKSRSQCAAGDLRSFIRRVKDANGEVPDLVLVESCITRKCLESCNNRKILKGIALGFKTSAWSSPVHFELNRWASLFL